jgi:hypothetical protein
VGAVAEQCKRSRLYEGLRLKGYVAFNLPRTVTTLGSILLAGIAAVHVYVLASRPALPRYFLIYAALLGGCCLFTAAVLWLGHKPLVPQLGWYFGDVVSFAFLGVYLVTRAVTLPGLLAVTGRWDFAPGTLSGAFALGFIAIHMSVLVGINVAHPQQQQWSD